MMKRTTLLLRCLGFLLGLAALLSALSWVYRPRNNTRRGGMNYIGSHGYLAYGEDELDAVFVGCSEFYAGISPLYLWGAWGITSYDAASGAQRIYESDSYIHELLRDHNLKVILLDGYTVVREGYNNNAFFEMAAQYFPVFTYHNNWKKYDWDLIRQPVRYRNRVVNKGYRPEDTVVPVDLSDYMDLRDGTEHFPLLNRLYLGHIQRLCQAHGVALVVVVMPSTYNWNGWYHEALAAETERLGIPFVDLNTRLEEVGLDGETDFRDEGDHLNVSGAEKVSDYLGRMLREEYGLPDHRGEAAYARWEQEWNDGQNQED